MHVCAQQQVKPKIWGAENQDPQILVFLQVCAPPFWDILLKISQKRVHFYQYSPRPLSLSPLFSFCVRPCLEGNEEGTREGRVIKERRS